MRDGFVKCAAASPEIRVADCDFNAKSIIEAIDKSYGLGVKLLVLPELCVTGYTCGDLFFQRILLDGVKKALKQIRDSVRDMLVFVGAPFMFESKLYNCAFAVCNKKILGAVPKRYLPNYNEFYEKRHFSVFNCENKILNFCDERFIFGDKLIFRCGDMPGFSVGAEICEDLWSVSPPSVKLAACGANIIVNLSASNEIAGKAEYRRDLVKGQSGRLICGYVYADAGEGESTTDMVFAGHNIIAENGGLLNESKLFSASNNFIVSEIDVQKLMSEREKNTTFTYSSEDILHVNFNISLSETFLTRKISKTPFIPGKDKDKNERCAEIFAMQTAGLRKRINHTKSKLVIGISGGLDSCLALLIVVRTINSLERSLADIIAITMPCFGTTKRTKFNAKALCDALNVTFREIDIKQSVLRHFADIEHDENNRNLVYENCQARERTQVLMDVANAEKALVVGTGDLSELALGWATYNGDHMSMYGVNAGVPKTLVRHLVKYYADISDNDKIREILYDILETPVSPELVPAENSKNSDNSEIFQETEKLIGPYELHDFFLYYAIRFAFPPKKVLRIAKYAFGGDYSENEIVKWLRKFYERFFSQQFKRSCLPDAPKVGSVSLSPRADWRMPSDACVKLWLNELN